ncbi:MAG: flagellar filament capping protein FliD [Paracoccaceae bacterium]|nr:flagellar filament capping protein FliD [Paracoccaceae bacterium]
MAIDYLSALNTKGSGLNITQIVDSLVEADVAPKKDALNKQISEKNTQISALAEVVADLSSLQADVNSLTNTTQLAPTSASSASLTIAVSDSAVAEEFTADVTVEALATAQTLNFTNSNFTAPTATIGSGTIAVQIGSWDSDFDSFTETSSTNISVSDGTTLTAFAAQLNAVSGVNASVLNVGDGTYSLVIKSELGAKNAINFDVAAGYGSASDPKTSLNVFDTETSGIGAVGASIHMVRATDAHLKVDGVSVYRDSNTITDVFDGYTVSPKVVNATSFRVQSSLDVDNAYNAMNSLVSSVNITKKLFSDMTNRELEGALADDPVIAAIERQLDKYFSGGVVGFFTSSVYMSELGVSTNRDGSISLSESKFREAMAVEPSSTVAGGTKLFNAVFNSSVYSDSSLLKVEKSTYVEPIAGVYTYVQSTGSPPSATIDGSGTGISTYSDAAPYFTSTQTNTSGLKITPSTTGNISSVNIFVGTSILDQLTTYIDVIMASTGDLSTRESTLGSQLTDYQIELEDIEAKTDGIRDRYMSQFPAMETAVTSLKSTGDYLTNMIESWNSDN